MRSSTRARRSSKRAMRCAPSTSTSSISRSEEHTSELQSLRQLVCRLLLEKKNLQDLAVLVLLVEHQLVGVLRRVELADRRPDAEMAEHALHTAGERLVVNRRRHAVAHGIV